MEEGFRVAKHRALKVDTAVLRRQLELLERFQRRVSGEEAA